VSGERQAGRQASRQAGEGRDAPARRIVTFRDLVAWQRAMELAEAVYRLTALLPSDERFGLTSQLRRAAVAIPSNIAEGYSRQSRQDYLRFLRMSRGSLSELSTQIEIARRVELCDPGQQLLDLIEEVGRILNALIRSLEQTEAQP